MAAPKKKPTVKKKPAEKKDEARVIEGPERPLPQPFLMVRNADETGVSGTGTVLEGCVFGNGKCVTAWTSGRPCVTVWDSYEAFKEVHIDPHPTNKTEIIWTTRCKKEGDE